MYMKNLILLTMFISAIASANCVEKKQTESKDVVHTVDTSIPAHLKGAKITVTLADGRTSTVPAEKFMVVPRKQQTVVGQDKLVKSVVTCSSKNKNLIIADLRKDVVDIETETSAIVGGVTAKTRTEKDLVPGINYFRRDLFDSNIGAGVGVDSNGTVKGMLGLEF
jgi:hypothetical protein